MNMTTTTTEMTESYFQEGEDGFVSIPRGGPVYVPDMVGPLTRVSDFEASVHQEVLKLKAEVCSDLSEMCDEELCVDELKIIAEEELVNKAFEEAFKDVVQTGNSSEVSEEQSNARKVISERWNNLQRLNKNKMKTKQQQDCTHSMVVAGLLNVRPCPLMDLRG